MQHKQASGSGVSRKAFAIVAVMMAGSFVSILNQNLMTTAIPHFMELFSVPSSTAQWLTTAFMLANGIMIPITAFLIQRFSTRSLFFTAMGLFGAGTLLCAAASSFEMLLVGRIVQALGAGITMPLMQTVLFVVFPPSKRGTAMGFYGLVIAFAPAMGPTISGWIVDSFPWQALFLLLVPIIVVDLIVAFFVVDNVTERSDTSLDMLSVVLSSIGFGGLLYSLSMVGTLGWSNPVVLGVLAVAVVALAWFIVRQLRLTIPMLEFRVFASRGFTTSMIVVVLAWSGFMGTSTLLPMYMQNTAGFTALESGMTLMAGGIVMGIMSPICGRVFDRYGARVMTPTGLVLALIATLMLSQLNASHGLVYIAAAFAVLMAGLAMVSMPLTTQAMNSLPPALVPHGTAMNNTMRSIVGALGTAVFVAVMAGASATAATGGAVDGASAGIDAAFLTMAGVTAVALVIALFVLRGSDTKKAASPEPAEAAGDAEAAPAHS